MVRELDKRKKPERASFSLEEALKPPCSPLIIKKKAAAKAAAFLLKERLAAQIEVFDKQRRCVD